MSFVKAIIPAAGLGTRFLPITKVIPKELLPILNKPAIHYIAKELIDSEIRECCLIINKEKRLLSHYFLPTNAPLKKVLSKKKSTILDSVDYLIDHLSYSYIFQKKPLGLGDAVLLANAFVENDFFSVLLPDDIITGPVPAQKQLLDSARNKQASVIGVTRVPLEKISSYGVIDVQEQINDRLFRVRKVIEKPTVSHAPSDMAIIGRYVLDPAIFKALDLVRLRLDNSELQLTDAIEVLINQNYPVFAYLIDGDRFDIGTPTGWLQANEHFEQLAKTD